LIRVKSKQKPEMEFVSKFAVAVRVSFSISLFCFDSGIVITVGFVVVVVSGVEAVDVVVAVGVVVVVGDSVGSFDSGRVIGSIIL